MSPEVDTSLPSTWSPPNAVGASPVQRLIVGTYLTGSCLALMYVLMHLWTEPVAVTIAGGQTASRYAVDLLWVNVMLPADVRLMLIASCMGGLGSLIHAGTSFVDYVGNRQLAAAWLWWYAMRPFIGASLALVLYFVVRGGFLQGSGAEAVNPYGIAAVAGLAGMFSKQATDKLDEIFRTMFKTDKADANRRDKLDAAAPVVSAVEPAKVSLGTLASVTVTGSQFVPASIGAVNGSPRVTTFVDSTRLKVELAAADVASAGTLRITVRNPEGATSMAAPVTIE